MPASVTPSTLAVSGGAPTAVVGMYLVRSALERIGIGERDPEIF